MPALLRSIVTPRFSPSSSVALSYFNLAFPMLECYGKHSCMSSPFPIVMLNGTFFFAKRDDLLGLKVAYQNLTLVIIMFTRLF